MKQPYPILEPPISKSIGPDIDGLAHRETITNETIPEGTFFDLAVIHVLTTSTIDRLRELYPQGRFEVRRFRPNIVVETGGEKDLVENNWIAKTLSIGEEVQINITGPCHRCDDNATAG